MKKNQQTASSVRLSATSRSQLVTSSVGKLARLVLASTRLVHAQPTAQPMVCSRSASACARTAVALRRCLVRVRARVTVRVRVRNRVWVRVRGQG